MPVAAFHANYWDNTGDAAAEPGAVAVPIAYVPWQTAVVLGGGFGVTQVVWEWFVQQVKERRDGHV